MSTGVRRSVVVIGGGPAGSVFAARLASRGHAVTVLEKARFPRFHLGESLLPQTLHALDAIGVLPAMHERFLVKRGAQFYDDAGAPSAVDEPRNVRFSFDGAFDARFVYSFQVPRDELDLLLLERATALGADVRQGVTVTAPVRGDDGAFVGVDAVDANGSPLRILADLVVDASGRDALVARAERATRSIDGLDGTSLYAHFEGVPRGEGDAAGDVRIVLCDGGWIWLIPFKDGRTSVGVVLPREGMRARTRASSRAGTGTGERRGAGDGIDVDGIFRDVLATTPTTRRLVLDAGARQLWPAEATADFSYRVERMHGPGWLCLGDAGGFIDPLFSTGVHLAVQGAFLAADAVDDASRAGDLSAARFDAWEQTVRRGAELFLTAVQAFYAGKLLPYMFASNPRTFLRRAITSMLAGDVFDTEARWARDMHSRLAALPGLASAASPGRAE